MCQRSGQTIGIIEGLGGGLDFSADWTTVLTPSIRRTVPREIKTVELRRIKGSKHACPGPIAAQAWDTQRTVVAYAPRMRMQKRWNRGAFLRRAIQECAGFHKNKRSRVGRGVEPFEEHPAWSPPGQKCGRK